MRVGKHRFWSQPLLACVLLLLAACATHDARPLDARRTAARLQQRRIDDPAMAPELARFKALGISAWPPAVYGPDQLYAAALVLNPDIAEARAKLAAAMAGVTTAKALPNPTLGAAFDRYQHEQADSSPWGWSLSLDLPLSALRNRGLQAALADTVVRSARLDYAELLWRTRTAVRSALRDLLVARQQQSLIAQTLAEQRLLTDAWQRRRDAGEAASGEWQLATLGLLQAQRDAAAAAARAQAAQAALARALGVVVDAVQELPLEWPGLMQPATVDAAALRPLREQALLSRSEVERALADYDAAELRLQSQLRLQYPQVSLGPTYTYDHGVRKIGMNASLTLPVFNRNRGPIAEAAAARTAAGLRLESAQAGVLNSIDAAAAALAQALDGLSQARSQQAVFARQLVQAEGALAAGAEDRITLGAARVAAGAAALNVLDAAAQAQSARMALEDALQAPLDPPTVSMRSLMQETGVAP